MSKVKRNRSVFILLPLFLLLLCGNIFFAFPDKAFGFSFAVMSDPHGASDSWKNSLTEAGDMSVNPAPKFSRPDFLLITGDTNPIDLRYEDFTEIFKNSPPAPLLLMAIGNHEFDDSGGMPGASSLGMRPSYQGQGVRGMALPQDQGPSGTAAPPQGQGKQPQTPSHGTGGQPPEAVGSASGSTFQPPGNPPGMYSNNGDPSIIDIEFIKEKIISAIPGVVCLSEDSCTYYYDHQNVRVICIDGFGGEVGQLGIINEAGRNWTEAAIKSAPASIDHIFIAFHAPAFPRVRHIHDSFSADPEQRNAFWNMLVAHRDKVRAVFCGHTHYYNRMRVFDPAGAAANDVTATPDEPNGIYQVNVGSAGNGMKNTFLRVEVNGKEILFRALEAENGKAQPFRVLDEWAIDSN